MTTSELKHFQESSLELRTDASRILKREILKSNTLKDIDNTLLPMETFILIDHDEAVGVGSLNVIKDRESYHIGYLAIKKTKQRMGYGTMLLGLLEEQALVLSQSPSVQIDLDSTDDAVEFYEKRGYEPGKPVFSLNGLTKIVSKD